MFTIGPWIVNQPSVLAPMAGITDHPFRRICRREGAGLAVSEMLASDTKLWNSRKSQQRLLRPDDCEPRSVQIAGNDPRVMAEAARQSESLGAQIVDINMGCPAKKVCKKAAGSALLRDEPLVAEILQSVVSAVNIPVTLKIRTGWSPEQKNGVNIARMAEDIGIQALAVHGRTRACAFRGDVEYDTIRDIVSAVGIPVIANGDIDSPSKARHVLKVTGASAVMIGRGAQGNPWIFREINEFLSTGRYLQKPSFNERVAVITEHLAALHEFYGEPQGVRVARKHINWYLTSWLNDKVSSSDIRSNHKTFFSQTDIKDTDRKNLGVGRNSTSTPDVDTEIFGGFKSFRHQFNRIESAQDQSESLLSYLDTLFKLEEQAA